MQSIKRPKILYISPNGFMGGAERFVFNAAYGHKGDAVRDSYLFFNDGLCEQSVRGLGKDVYLLPFKLRLRNLFSIVKTVKYIRSIVRSDGVDILHSTMPYAHIIASLVRLTTDVKTVWFQHGPVGGILDKIANIFPANIIFFNSRYLQSEHNKMFLAKRFLERHRMINYGNQQIDVDRSEREKIRGQHLQDRKVLLGTVGRICDWKGQLNVLKSLKKLIEQSETSFRYLMIGSANSDVDKKYEEEIKKYILENEMSDLVEFVPHVTNVQDYMSALDVLIHSSSIPEPFGLVVSEAMLTHTLVIGSDKGGVTDILKDGETGFSYHSTDHDAVDSLTETLQRLLPIIENDEVKVIKDAAFERISTDYNISQMIESLERSYLEL